MPVAEVPKRTSQEWDQELSRIYAAHESGEARLATIIAERRALALGAADGDPAAVEAIRALNEQHGELAGQLDLLKLAAGEASEHRRKAASAEEVAERAATFAEAQAVAALLIDESRIIDAGLRAAAEALERRQLLVSRLAGLGWKRNTLLHAERVVRAAGAAGWRGRLPLSFGSPPTWQALAEADGALLAALLEQPAARRAA